MSNTFKHKIERKFTKGLIEYKDVPMSVKNKWNRSNRDWDEFRMLKKKLIEKIMNKEMKDYGKTET